MYFLKIMWLRFPHVNGELLSSCPSNYKGEKDEKKRKKGGRDDVEGPSRCMRGFFLKRFKEFKDTFPQYLSSSPKNVNQL